MTEGGIKQQAALKWMRTAESKNFAEALKACFDGLTPEAQVTIIQICIDRDDMREYKDLHKITGKAVSKIMGTEGKEGLKQKLFGIMLKVHKVPNLAADAKATSPDGLDKDGQAGGDAAAIDDDYGTYWDEVDNKDLYRLCIELKKPASASAISITGYQHHQYAPKDFEIICDGKTIKTVKDAAYSNNELIVVFDEVKGKTFELKITGYYGRSPAIRELKIYNTNIHRRNHEH